MKPDREHEDVVLDSLTVNTIEMPMEQEDVHLVRLSAVISQSLVGIAERGAVGSLFLKRHGRYIRFGEPDLFGAYEELVYEPSIPFPVERGDVFGWRGLVESDEDRVLLKAVVQ